MGKYYYDDTDARLDKAISKANEALEEAYNAWVAFDRVNERYMRTRSRAESGRMSTIYRADKLGTKVSSSGKGGNGDDLLIEVVEQHKLTDVQRTLYQMAQYRVMTLIRECCGAGTKEAKALELRHVQFPCLPFGQMPISYPEIFKNKNDATNAYRRGVTKIAEYYLEHEDDAA